LEDKYSENKIFCEDCNNNYFISAYSNNIHSSCIIINSFTDGYILISTQAELNAIRNNLTGKYRLSKNITLTGSWTPIGNSTASTAFTGELDGAEYTISGLNISVSTGYGGLFGRTSGAVIKNLTLEGSVTYTATGYSRTGAFIGYAQGSILLENCVSKVNVTGTSYLGGFIGEGSLNNALIKNCTYMGKLTGTNYIGGIIGYMTNAGTASSTIPSKISQCRVVVNPNAKPNDTSEYLTERITGRQYVGGIAGRFSGTIEQCYTTVKISASEASSSGSNGQVGVIIGYAVDDNNVGATIQDCFSTGDIISVGSNAGGISGMFATSSFGRMSIDRCYSTSYVLSQTTSHGTRTGGIVAEIKSASNSVKNSFAINRQIRQEHTNPSIGRISNTDSMTASNNYAKSDIPLYWRGALQNITDGTTSNKNGQNISDTQLRTATPYTSAGWNFNNVWIMNPAVSPYPVLRWAHAPGNLTVSPTSVTIDVNQTSGTITANNVNQGDSVIWNIANTNIATVIPNGNTATVVGKAAGTTQLTVTTTWGAGPINIPITVKTPPLAVNPTNITIDVGQTSGTITASGMLTGDSAVWGNPVNSNIATINKNGNTITVTGKAPGTTTFTVTTAFGASPITVTVTVKPATLTVNPTNITINVGQTSGTITANDMVNGDSAVWGNPANTNIVIINKNGNTATVVGVSPGTITIPVTTAFGATPVNVTVTVLQPPPPSIYDITIEVGETHLITVSSLLVGDSVIWGNSSDSNIATITPNGNAATVLGVSPGVATFIVNTAFGAPPQTVTVTVTAPPVIELDSLVIALDIGEYCKLAGLTAVDTIADMSGYAWQSSDANIATVDSKGKVTAVNYGVAEITASNGTITQSIKILVRPEYIEVTNVILNKITTIITKGNTEILMETVLPVDATNKSVTWSSDNPSVATVDNNGVVTAVSEGKANITVTTIDGNKTANCIVTVIEGDIVQIAAGEKHMLILKADGTVWAWGSNSHGQLGNGVIGTLIIETAPVKVKNLENVTAISAGGLFSMALKDDGTVWAWGQNNCGQISYGPGGASTLPERVRGVENVTAISGGLYHSMALKNDGTVWTWGWNGYGQLGDNTVVDRAMPEQVAGLSSIISVSAGHAHSIALKNDGTVRTWGQNNYGQLGDDTVTQRLIPVEVTGLSGVKTISAGAYHSMALMNDGTVRAWGANNHGRLGDGSTINRKIPVAVSGLSGVISISGGNSHSVALKSNGMVYTWGNNEFGQLGDNIATQRDVPEQVTCLSGVIAISAGSKSNHNMALMSNGTVYAWGLNNYGQLGDGTTIDSPVPLTIQIP